MDQRSEQNLRDLFFRYLGEEDLPAWESLRKAYTQEGRHYHDLHHIAYMMEHFQRLIQKFEHPAEAALAIFFHDAVYDPSRSDNEEKSAEMAREYLKQKNWDETQIQQCYDHILATKSHQSSADPDTNLLIDIDLAILSEPWEKYQTYARQVRQEYTIYPDELYYPGRLMVLQHLNSTFSIYKTEDFQNFREAIAHQNLEREMEEIRQKAY